MISNIERLYPVWEAAKTLILDGEEYQEWNLTPWVDILDTVERGGNPLVLSLYSSTTGRHIYEYNLINSSNVVGSCELLRKTGNRLSVSSFIFPDISMEPILDSESYHLIGEGERDIHYGTAIKALVGERHESHGLHSPVDDLSIRTWLSKNGYRLIPHAKGDLAGSLSAGHYAILDVLIKKGDIMEAKSFEFGSLPEKVAFKKGLEYAAGSSFVTDIQDLPSDELHSSEIKEALLAAPLVKI